MRFMGIVDDAIWNFNLTEQNYEIRFSHKNIKIDYIIQKIKKN